MKNKENLKGLLALTLFTTLIWSLNINFGFFKVSWLEIFGAVSIGVMVGSVFYTFDKK
jgi:hypothetical protein